VVKYVKPICRRQNQALCALSKPNFNTKGSGFARDFCKFSAAFLLLKSWLDYVKEQPLAGYLGE
jgi:hypothetical protein